MFEAVEIKDDVYWVGAVDWDVRNFHGYTTNQGSTYNAYLILDEKITLIDACKKSFSQEMIERISQIVDPSKIDYIISNHVEMDHSESIPCIMELAPHAAIITSDSWGLKGLQAHYGNKFAYKSVKSGETLSIGKRTLTFVHTLMVHWPDNMVTYSEYDKILFSNDAFGQHFASSHRFDDEEDLCEVLAQAKKYYANIVMPYSHHAAKALEVCKGLDIEIIAPSHGVIWRSHIDKILESYDVWTSGQADEFALVVYDSMYHSTEKMAIAITQAFSDLSIPVRPYDLKSNHISDIMADVLTAKYLAVGSPTLNNNMLPTVSAFLCYLRGLSPKNRTGIAFGSYGWGPKGQEQVSAELEAAAYEQPLEIFSHNWTCDEDYLEELRSTVREGIKNLR